MVHTNQKPTLDSLPNPSKFSIMIEKLSKSTEMGYIETILSYCDENSIEFETVAKLVNPTLKDKLRKEFSEIHNLLPKQPKLKRKTK
jgi:hypothetical protein